MCILNGLGLIRRAERSRPVRQPSNGHLAQQLAVIVTIRGSLVPAAPPRVSRAAHAHPDGITREEVMVMTDAPHDWPGEQASSPIQRSPAFQQAWQDLSAPLQRTVERKIALLSTNPAHPSLKAHRVKRLPHADVWICYVSATLRLLYQREAHAIHLLDVGPHRIIDRVHLRCFPTTATFENSDGSRRQGTPRGVPRAQQGRPRKRNRRRL